MRLNVSTFEVKCQMYWVYSTRRCTTANYWEHVGFSKTGFPVTKIDVTRIVYQGSRISLTYC